MSTRLLFPNEFNLYRNHIRNLDSNSLFCRFGGHLSKESINSYLTGMKPSKNIIIGHFFDKKVVGAVVIAFSDFLNKDICELAISVDPNYRKKGIGIKLFKRAILWACNLGFKKIFLQCLRQNQWMVSQAKKLGFLLINEEGEVFATMEPNVYQRLGLLNLLTIEILEWNHNVLENTFNNWNIFGGLDKSSPV